MDSVYSILVSLDKRIRQATLFALLDAAEEIKERGLAVQDEWTHKVDFKQQTTFDPTYIEVLVTPAGNNKNIWTYVDLGTGKYGKNKAAYPIVPKKPGGLLKFRTGYSAKTAPVARANVGTGIASGNFVSTAKVMHPGVKPRQFSETFAKQLTPPLDVRVTEEIKKVI